MRFIARECLTSLIWLFVGFLAIPIIIAAVAPYSTTETYPFNLGYVYGMLFFEQDPYVDMIVVWSLVILPYLLAQIARLTRWSFLVQRIPEFFAGLGSIIIGVIILLVGVNTCLIWFSLCLAFLLYLFFRPIHFTIF